MTSDDRKSLAEALNICASFKFRRVSRLVTQIFDEALQPTGFRSTQLVILLALAEEDEIAHSRLARKLVVSPSSLTRALKPLERKGLIAVAGRDGRRNMIRLTDHGLAAANDAKPYWRRAQDEVLSHIKEDAWSPMADNLDAVADALRAR